MKRIYSIDLFKLIFAYFIALGHFGIELTPGAEATVQIFFIISGFFLAKKFYSKRAKQENDGYNQWNYTLDHVKSLYPHYLFSLLVLACYNLVQPVITLLTQFDVQQFGVIAQRIYGLIPELVFLQNAGFFEGGINYPLWQVCVLLIGGYFVYGALCINEKRSRQFLFPAAILMIQTLLKNGADIWGAVGFFHVPILRAISPMCIGVLTYHFTTTQYYEMLKSKTVLYNSMSVLLLAAIFMLGEYQNIFLITFPAVLLAMYDENSWLNKVFNRPYFAKFGEFSYAIYLNHALIINIGFRVLFPLINTWIGRELSVIMQGVIYLVVLTLYSVVTMYVVNKCKAVRKKTN